MVLGYRPTQPAPPAPQRDGPLVDGRLRAGGRRLLPPPFRNQPAVNVWEQEDALKVEMEVPGVKSQELDISVAGGELSIHIERPDVAQEGRLPSPRAAGRTFSRVVSACRSKSTPTGSRPTSATAC